MLDGAEHLGASSAGPPRRQSKSSWICSIAALSSGHPNCAKQVWIRSGPVPHRSVVARQCGGTARFIAGLEGFVFARGRA